MSTITKVCRIMKSEYVTKDEVELLIQEAKPQLKEPSLYQVIIHNDDYTPMIFVIDVLEMFFNMDSVRAEGVMYQIHTAGKAVCGVFSKDVAETKVDQVMEYARTHEHPLMCSIEAVE